MVQIENDHQTYHKGCEPGVITCAYVGCERRVRYNCDAATRPRYCREHTETLKARGYDETDIRAKNGAVKRRSILEVLGDFL